MNYEMLIPPAYRKAGDQDTVDTLTMFYDTDANDYAPLSAEHWGRPAGELAIFARLISPIVGRLDILDMLQATVCVCGSSKARMKSHCPKCFASLSPEKKKALYKRFGRGYEEAFMDSLNVLLEDGRTTREGVQAAVPTLRPGRKVQGAAKLKGKG